MSKENTLVPELRFPEFKKDGKWKFMQGNELFATISNKNHNSDLPILAISQEYGAIPRELIDYTVIATEESIKSYKVVEIGDFIISLRSFQGGIEYSNYKGICSPAYIILRKKRNLINLFFKFYFKSDFYIRQMNKNLEGIRDGKMVSFIHFSAILLPYPALSEQQKIAACLSSLEELIDLNSKKLTLLKEYKKGLMHVLFPQEGDKVPKFRFLDFKNDGEWEEKKLSDISILITKKNRDNKVSRVLTNSAINGIVDQRDYFERDIVTESNLEGYNIVNCGDFVYNPRVSTIAPVGPISVNKVGLGVMSPLYTVFRFNSGNVDFFEQYFKTNIWHSYLRNNSNSGARHDRMSISVRNFVSLPMLLPSLAEQQKIASCISTLDAIISAQFEKVNQLKLHKKGLMQNLFPRIE